MPEETPTSSPPAGSVNTEDRSLSQKENEDRQFSNASEVKEDEKPAPLPQQQPAPGDGESSQGGAAKKLALLSSVFMCMFLVALDRTIISTAIPQITQEFDSLSDVGWYGSAYLLTCCAFQLLFGKVYTYFSVKGTFLCSLLLFEVASALCGSAPNSDAFIVGRAISGVGAAGIFAGTIVCIVHTMPLHQRPKIQGLFGALFGLASVIGPLIGGAFTSNVTWRWCFYINLPFGGVAAVFVLALLKIPDRETTKEPLSKKLAQLDLLGTSFLVPSLVCLLLALQWGGQTYGWSNWRIILLLVLFAVLFIAFVAVQIYFPHTATLPPRIFKYRSVLAAFWMSLIIGAANYILLYFIPVWFQAIKGASPIQSGIRLLPLMLSVVLGSMLGGFTTTRIGYYNPYSIAGACIMSVGAGLIYTWDINTSEGIWIGYQILFGFGQGICFQTPNLAVQNTLPKQDNPVGLALMLFGQMLGAAIFVSVGENVLGNQLVSRLSKYPGFSAKDVTSAGAATLIDSFPKADRAAVKVQYNKALQTVFLAGLIVSCLTILGAVALEWKPIKKPGPPPQSKPSAEEGVTVNEGGLSQDAEKNV